MRSLRFRLTLWYGGALAAILCAGALCVYVGAKHALLSETDAFLTLEAQRTAYVAEGDQRDAGDYTELREAVSSFQGSGQSPRSFPGLLRFDSVYVRLATPKNATVAVSPSLSSHPDLQDSLNEMNVSNFKGGRHFAFSGPDEERMLRVIVAPVEAAGRPLLIQIAVPWDHDTDVLEQLGYVLMIAVPALTFAASLGGWALVGRTLRPIQRIATEAEQLEIDNFSGPLLPAPSETDSEVGNLVATLNRMTIRLHKAFEAKQRFAEAQQRFAADASHELRTPLTVLRGEMELTLSRPRAEEEYIATLGSALEEIQQMTHIVESLSFLARTDTGHIENEGARVPVDLQSLCERTSAHFEREAEAHGVTVSFLPSPEPVRVTGDPVQLRQLLDNLVDNAVKYSRSGDLVTISVSGERAPSDGAAEAVITVSDMGIGIAPEDLPHIFDRFWRADSARSAPGSGLGLAICARIAEAHGGRLAVQSELGSGTQITLRIPVAG
ncbi:two-component sensor histidine kinase [Capsulimonas corticalis]|uniref:histidine kinase n=2 Tax=Capsulimonas corticalis TaxID=2219043 RepID=A0A402CVE6_9BACT|nr:two-component sensor histidine kinase [Capsulimonas corticalis]